MVKFFPLQRFGQVDQFVVERVYRLEQSWLEAIKKIDGEKFAVNFPKFK